MTSRGFGTASTFARKSTSIEPRRPRHSPKLPYVHAPQHQCSKKPPPPKRRSEPSSNKSSKTCNLTRTLTHLQNLLALKPNDPVAQYLFRRYQWQSRLGRAGGLLASAFAPAKTPSTLASYEEPFLRKWGGLAGLVFFLFGIGTVAGVTIYIKQKGKQAVAVHVTDEAMKEGNEVIRNELPEPA